MVSERSIVIYLAHKGGHFSPKSWNISRMLPKHMCDRPPRISYFAHKFSLTRFFPKKGVNFNFLRQNKYDKVRPISVTKDIILLIHIKKVRRLCHKAPKKHHTLPADVLPNASEALLVDLTITHHRNEPTPKCAIQTVVFRGSRMFWKHSRFKSPTHPDIYNLV